MKFVTAGIFIAMFLAGVYLFGAAFSAPEGMEAITFGAGIVLVGLAIGIPQHFIGYGNSKPSTGQTGGELPRSH